MKRVVLVMAVVAALWLMTASLPAFAMEPAVAGAVQRVPAAGVRPNGGGLLLLAIVGIGAIGAAGGMAGFLLATRSSGHGTDPSRAR